MEFLTREDPYNKKVNFKVSFDKAEYERLLCSLDGIEKQALQIAWKTNKASDYFLVLHAVALKAEKDNCKDNGEFESLAADNQLVYEMDEKECEFSG